MLATFIASLVLTFTPAHAITREQSLRMQALTIPAVCVYVGADAMTFASCE